MTPILLLVAAFVTAAAVVLGGALLILDAPNAPQARVRSRLAALHEPAAPADGALQVPLKRETLSELALLDRMLGEFKQADTLRRLLARADLRVPVGVIVLGAVWCGVLAALFLWHKGLPLPLAVIGGSLGALAPFLYVQLRVRRRLRKFLEQMPDGLDTIAQALQAGLGLSHAELFLAKDAPEPMRGEFSVFLREMNLGLPLREAIDNFEKRMPLHEVRLFSTAVVLQRDVGGNLSVVLSKLADVIRDRFRIEREIRSLTAQNRFAAWVVSSLPVVLSITMYTINPKLMSPAFHHPVGQLMLGMAAVLWMTGVVVFWKMLRIHI